MDAISGVASVRQLIAYCLSAAKSLTGLYKAVRNSPSAFRDQELNISLLLDIVYRIRSRNPSVSESVLPLFIQISDSANRIKNLLDQKNIIGISWVSIINFESLADAFEVLNRKKDILQLYLSGSNHEILTRLQGNITNIGQRICCVVHAKDSMEDSHVGVWFRSELRKSKRRKDKDGEKDQKSGKGATQSIPPAANSKTHVSHVKAERNRAGDGSTQSIGIGWAPFLQQRDLECNKNVAGKNCYSRIACATDEPFPPRSSKTNVDSSENEEHEDSGNQV